MVPDFVCSFFPDGIPRWLGGTGSEWLSCCIEHDVTDLAMVPSDFAMADCMAGLGYPLVGLVALAGLLTIGIPFRLIMRARK